MKKEIYSIPGKMVGHHHPDINCIVDSWTSLFVTLDEWKSTVYDIGITDYAPRNGVTSWIIDTSKASGVFKPEIQEFRTNVARPKLEENGVTRLFVVLPASAIGKLSARKTAKLYDAKGILKAYDVMSIEEAFDIIKEDK